MAAFQCHVPSVVTLNSHYYPFVWLLIFLLNVTGSFEYSSIQHSPIASALFCLTVTKVGCT